MLYKAAWDRKTYIEKYIDINVLLHQSVGKKNSLGQPPVLCERMEIQKWFVCFFHISIDCGRSVVCMLGEDLLWVWDSTLRPSSGTRGRGKKMLLRASIS